MSQISPPIRILLVCAVAFMAAWMLFLRPKDDAGVPAALAPAPAAEKPVDAGGPDATSLAGKAVEKANEATAAQDARAEELAGGAGETAATPAPATTPADATTTQAPSTTATAETAPGAPVDVALPSEQELARVPKPVRTAILDRKIVVLSVLAPKGVDDKLMADELENVDKLDGRVAVRTVKVKDVSRYSAVTRGVDLEQTPTTIVIGYDLKATTIAGWVDAKTVDQAVVDTIRNSGGRLFTNTYLRRTDQICTSVSLKTIEGQVSTTPAQFATALGTTGSALTAAERKTAALKPPAKLRSFDKAVRADYVAAAALLANWRGALGSKPSAAKVVATSKTYGPKVTKLEKRFNARMEAKSVFGCA